MLTLRLHGAHDLRVHEEPVPRPGPGEALVRVKAVGLCGSDLHWWEEGNIGGRAPAGPLVLGHETSGVTAEGRRVAVDPAIPCGACDRCAEGNPNLCETVRFAGYDEDGALREWISWPARCLFPIPDRMTDAEAAVLEPLGVALHAVDLAQVARGMRVGVFGCGPIGWLTIQVAHLAGAGTVIATERPFRPHRLDAARRLGAEVFAADGTEARAIREATGGRGLDAAIEFAGENDAVDAAVDAVRPGARIILGGIPAEERTSFVAATARRKGLTFKLARRMKGTYPRAIRLVEEGAIDVASVITHRLPLDAGRAAFEAAARRDGLKVIVEVS